MPPSPRAPTLATIAKACRLSKAAVSLALRNDRRVSEATKARVAQVAGQVGYRLDPFLNAQMSALRRSGSRKDGVSIAYLQYYDTLPNNRFLAGVRARCEALGHACNVIRPAAERLSGTRVAGILATRGISGVIVGPLPTPGGTVDLPWPRLASVAVGYSLGSPGLHRAGTDMAGTMELTLEELTARGYRRPGYVSTLESQRRTRMQTLGRLLAWQRLESEARPVPPLVDAAISESAFRRWLEQHRPDAIIGSDPRLREWLQRAGRPAPGKIGLCNAGIYGVAREVSGVEEELHTVGSAAVDLLFGQLYHNERGVPASPRLTVVPGRWHEGMTLRPRSS